MQVRQFYTCQYAVDVAPMSETNEQWKEDLCTEVVNTIINDEASTAKWQQAWCSATHCLDFGWVVQITDTVKQMAYSILSDSTMCSVPADSYFSCASRQCSDCSCMRLLGISQY